MSTPLLLSRRFSPLFWCQFFSAFSDNFLKTALSFLIVYHATDGGDSLVQLAAAVFIAPYFILSALGGQIADRFDKAIIAQRLKLAEIGVAVIAVLGFWVHSLLVLFVALLYLLRDVLMPFIAGFILAYLLDPLADRLERLGLGRLAASLVILALAVAVLVVTLLILAPVAVKQIAGLAAALPGTVQRLQAILAEHAGPLLQKVGGADVLSDLQSSVGTLAAQGGSWLMTFLASLWTGSQALVSIVSLLVVTPVVAFYILVDWDRMIDTNLRGYLHAIAAVLPSNPGKIAVNTAHAPGKQYLRRIIGGVVVIVVVPMAIVVAM